MNTPLAVPSDGGSTGAERGKRSNHRRVRVWFGEHVIADYTAQACITDRYAAAMERRFAGLRVTSDPVSDPSSLNGQLPAEHWWQVPPR